MPTSPGTSRRKRGRGQLPTLILVNFDNRGECILNVGQRLGNGVPFRDQLRQYGRGHGIPTLSLGRQDKRYCVVHANVFRRPTLNLSCFNFFANKGYGMSSIFFNSAGRPKQPPKSFMVWPPRHRPLGFRGLIDRRLWRDCRTACLLLSGVVTGSHCVVQPLRPVLPIRCSRVFSGRPDHIPDATLQASFAPRVGAQACQNPAREESTRARNMDRIGQLLRSGFRNLLLPR